MRRGALLALALLAPLLPGATAAAPLEDPVLWPEPQRAFLQDGPGLLLTPEQRRELLALDEAGRDAFALRFLADPLPETAANELIEGIERRRRLAFAEHSPADARAQLLFLLGPPPRRLVVDCGSAFKPLEIWHYGPEPDRRRLVLYRAAPGEAYRIWLPLDSKAALYTRDMAAWLAQWEGAGIGGKRIDRRFCPLSAEVDEATGVDGLRGREEGAAPPEREYRWTAPADRAWHLARPADLAAWAREAAATPLPPAPPRLALEEVEMDFPGRHGQRLSARFLVLLRPPGQPGGAVVAGSAGQPRMRLLVEGTIERQGSPFEEVRVRYRLPPPEEGVPVALLFERPLRPDQTFLLRLRLQDEVSGAEARVVRGFQVPSRPEPRLPRRRALEAARGEELAPVPIGRDSVLLVPPTDEITMGTWRAETLVSGRVAKVVFLVDGEPQLTRTREPYSAEVRLAPTPREQVVRVEGYDREGQLVAADQVVLNRTRGAFRVVLAEPAAGAEVGRRALVRAEILVPDGHRVESLELRVNDVLQSFLASPPWEAEVEIPDEEVIHLAATARLDDGRSAEAVSFLRAPEHLERVDVNLVELYTTVTAGSGASGDLLLGLTVEDFQILEGGRPQAIARFDLVENLPLTLGFAIDASTSMASSLVEAQRAAEGFLRRLLPRDRAFAVGFASRPYLLMPPTDDMEAVSQSLEGLRAAGRTALHDGLITALYHFRGYRGQRALVLLSDGEDTASSTPWEKVLEYARRSGVAIYPVGLDVSPLALEARRRLSALAEATGGRASFVQHASELTGAYAEIERELRHRYFLAYYSDHAASEDGGLPVEVRVRRGRARTARAVH